MPVGEGSVQPAAERRDARDQLDPELLELPDPPRRERRVTVVLVAVTAIACLAMAAALGRDALYALRAPARPVDLPDLRGVGTAGLAEDGYACAHGVLGASGAVRFERPFEADSYRLSPVVGREDVWVEVRVPPGLESGRWVPPTSFCGRLLRFEHAGLRRRGLASAVEAATERRSGKSIGLGSARSA